MLHDFVRTSLSAEELGDLLTMAGFELEGIETVDGEPVLDIKVMSNRGDGLSVFGLAREVLAKDAASEPTELYRRAANRFADLPTTGTENPATVTRTPPTMKAPTASDKVKSPGAIVARMAAPGAEKAIITGIRPAVAKALIELGVNLGSLVTRSTLQAGIAYALGRSGGSGARAKYSKA